MAEAVRANSDGAPGAGRGPAVCPACGRETPRGPGPGDLAACSGCGIPFWASDGGERGRPVQPPERPPLSSVGVAAFHLGVLAAELVLASAVAGLFAGLPAFAVGRLAGIW